ncbi:MAG: WbqC family protein [Flavobacteriales bacterium]|nr:WbqC family protein [Flavobacteriales bacterium]
MHLLLSSFCFGSVEHYRMLARHPKVVIDIGEHYVRQSYRTRTSIIGPNGVQQLSAQVEHGHGLKMPMREVRLSYAESWPAQHLHAIRSAYGKTPWLIHYIDEIEAVMTTHHERLIDLNMATLQLGLRWLGLPTRVEVAEHYVEDPAGMADLRTSFHPKKPLPPEVPPTLPYAQVFADRHGFHPRMSVIDLVCNCGPDAPVHVLN